MRWLQLGAPAGAILLLAALAGPATPALAADNVVSVAPSGVDVAPGGTFHVAVKDDPSPASTAIWAIDVVYDPAVVSTSTDDCDPIDTPPGAIGAFDCSVIDADKNGTPETVKALGVVLFSGTGTGLIKESTLADITFHATGAAGACTDLHMRIRNHADNDGKETGALVQDGRVCIKSTAPPVGTESPNPVTPRTSEPTPAPTRPGDTGAATPSASQNGQQSGSPGATAPTGAQASGTSSTARTSATATASIGPGGQVDDKDDGGAGALAWVIAGGIVLVLAGAGAWLLVRMRARPPAAGPPS